MIPLACLYVIVLKSDWSVTGYSRCIARSRWVWGYAQKKCMV